MQFLPESHSGNLDLTNLLPPFLLGFLATSFQILLLREFSAYFYGNELTFGIILASWLLWGSVGSLVSSRMKPAPCHLPQLYLAILVIFPLAILCVRLSRFFLGTIPGELVGLTPILVLSLGLCLLVSFPLGVLFVFNVGLAQGRITQVYIAESLGAAAGGLMVYWALIPFTSHWLAASLIGISSALLIFLTFGKAHFRPWWMFVPALLFVFVFFDLPSQKMYWRPFHLVASRDSRYGKLQVVRSEEQVSLYSNGARVFSYPNPAAAEESVHFALLQRPEARKVLLIGGGEGGSLEEALKYPLVEVDYVELDPEIVRLSERYLGEPLAGPSGRGRVRVFFRDGRAFLQESSEKFELIILNLPEPASAQVNRFYTREFFLLAASRLKPGGVFSFIVPSSESYIGPSLQKFLASLHFTLASSFPKVKVVPGEQNIYLASAGPLTIDADELSRRIESFNLHNSYVTPGFLSVRLQPRRIQYLEEKLQEGPLRINTDLRPVGFYLQAVFWSAQFRGIDARVLDFFSRIPLFWLLDVPLLLVLAVFVALRLKRSALGFYLAPLTVMGLTTIAIEIVILIWFQALYGYLYGRIALLLAIFMLGLFVGSLVSSKTGGAAMKRLTLIQLGFTLLVVLSWLALATRPPEIVPFLSLFLAGYFGGDLFIVSCSLYLKKKTAYGLGYGLDLGGSFLGALAISSLLIPLAGLNLVLRSIFLLNLGCFLFLLFRPKNI
jgi:spermidine synthase